jgi:hypothetical protein
MLHREAKAILDKWCQRKTGRPASTGKRAYPPRPLEKASSLEWWTEAGGAKETTDRTIAYLKAYCEISGSARFSARGIKLDDSGYLWIDKGVVRFAMSKDLITFDSKRVEFVVHRNICSDAE